MKGITMKQLRVPVMIKRTFLMAIVLVGCLGFPLASAQAERAQAAAIVELAREAMTKYHLKAVIVRVTIDGEEVVTKALGESMTGVPATEDMHFRNGAVADLLHVHLAASAGRPEVVSLDDKLSNWLPELPDAERVTLRMLANMTAGYPDYVLNEQFIEGVYANPFRQWTPQEQIDIAYPRLGCSSGHQLGLRTFELRDSRGLRWRRLRANR
jgi:CubicO group peptidase (beta-lactamase class C family)